MFGAEGEPEPARAIVRQPSHRRLLKFPGIASKRSAVVSDADAEALGVYSGDP